MRLLRTYCGKTVRNFVFVHQIKREPYENVWIGFIYNWTPWKKRPPPLSIEECIDQFNTKRPTLVFFGSHETSPIMDIHKPAPAIQSYLRVKRWQVGAKKTLPWWLGEGGVQTTENKIHLPCWMTQREERLREKEVGSYYFCVDWSRRRQFQWQKIHSFYNSLLDLNKESKIRRKDMKHDCT